MIVMPLVWTGSGAVLNPDKCAACLTCVRVCPYEVPTVHNGVVRIDNYRCQACGICPAECPAGAIHMMYHRKELMFQLLEMLFRKLPESRDEPTIIGFRCYRPSSTDGSGETGNVSVPDNVGVINVLCTGRVATSYLLKAFELGADGVFVTVCTDGECLHKTGNQFVRQRVESLKKQLDAIGVGGGRLEIFSIPPGDNSQFNQAVSEMNKRIKEMAPSPVGKP